MDLVKRFALAISVSVASGAALYTWGIGALSLVPSLLGADLTLVPVLALGLAGRRLRRRFGRLPVVSVWVGVAPVLLLFAFAFWFGYSMQRSSL